MPNFRTLDDLQVKGKRVLVRADLNVPMKDGHVTDASRIERQAPTIRELSSKGARIIVLSHFDRPKGKVVPSMSLKPIAPALSKALGLSVAFAEDCVGPIAQAAVVHRRLRGSPQQGNHLAGYHGRRHGHYRFQGGDAGFPAAADPQGQQAGRHQIHAPLGNRQRQ